MCMEKMSRKGKYKFKKDPKQPSVTNLLPSASKTPLSQTTSEPSTSTNSAYREKRRRNTTDSSETLSTTPPTPNQLKINKEAMWLYAELFWVSGMCKSVKCPNIKASGCVM